MDNLEIRKKALSQLMGDMDDIEGKGLFPEEGEPTSMGGVEVSISVTPKADEAAEEAKEEKLPETDTMDSGADEEETGLPSFMRRGFKR